MKSYSISICANQRKNYLLNSLIRQKKCYILARSSCGLLFRFFQSIIYVIKIIEINKICLFFSNFVVNMIFYKITNCVGTNVEGRGDYVMLLVFM